ncbi:hypothetical protein IID22_03240 [Patescibacteria group bacterium]|nr:hypothetical protein [Patescibacteria group bacterium]
MVNKIEILGENGVSEEVPADIKVEDRKTTIKTLKEEDIDDPRAWVNYRKELLEYLKSTDPNKEEDSIKEETDLLNYVEKAKSTDEPAEKYLDLFEDSYVFNRRHQEEKGFRDEDELKIERRQFNELLRIVYGERILDDILVKVAQEHIAHQTGRLVRQAKR